MNELKPLSYSEAEIIIDFLSSSYEKTIEFTHPTMGNVYVESITFAPFFEQDYKDYVSKIEKNDTDVSGHYWGHTYRIVVIVVKEKHFRSAFYLRESKVFTIQELQQLDIIGFEYPDDILDELEYDDEDS